MVNLPIEIDGPRSFSVEGWKVLPDDRQQTMEVLGGTVVQDFGHLESGDKYSCTADFMLSDWQAIKKLWNDRTLVSVKDEAGIIHTKLRVVVKGYSYVSHFPRCYKVNLEFWRV